MNNGHHGNGLSADTMRRFRRAAARFATGVAVVTSMADDVPVGMTINSFATVSLDPTMLLICLQHRSRLLSSIEQSGVFAVTILAGEQQRQAQWFATRARPTGAPAFAGIPMRHAPATGCLVLSEGLAYFDCRVRDLYPGGDHAIVLGEVAACGELWPREPLLFVDGRYVALDSGDAVDHQLLDHWAAPGAAAAASSAAGLSTSAIDWAVTTRR